MYGGGSSLGYREFTASFCYLDFDPFGFVAGLFDSFACHPVIFDCYSEMDLQLIYAYLVFPAVALGSEIPAKGEGTHTGCFDVFHGHKPGVSGKSVEVV